MIFQGEEDVGNGTLDIVEGKTIVSMGIEWFRLFRKLIVWSVFLDCLKMMMLKVVVLNFEIFFCYPGILQISLNFLSFFSKFSLILADFSIIFSNFPQFFKEIFSVSPNHKNFLQFSSISYQFPNNFTRIPKEMIQKTTRSLQLPPIKGLQTKLLINYLNFLKPMKKIK